MSGHGTLVLGASTTTASALLLPHTGNGTTTSIITIVTLSLGVVMVVSSLANVIYKKLR